MRYLLATLLAVLTLASPAFASSVSNVTVTNDVPTRAAGARTVYLVNFATSAPSGGLSSAANSRITVRFPTGTGFSGWVRGQVRVAGQVIGGCSSPNPANSSIECFLNSGRTVAAGEAVQVAFEGVTNPGNGTEFRIAVSTTADTDIVNSAFTVAPAGRLSEITLDNTAPSAAAGAQTVYVARFKVSATGGMSEQANSRIHITFPPLTGYLGWSRGIVSVGGVDVGGCSTPNNAAIECWLNSGQSIAGDSTVQIKLEGITNATEAGTDKEVRVDTTSDPASLPSVPFTVLRGNRVDAVAVQNGTPSNAAGARTRYVVGFTLSDTGGLSEDANSRIDVTFPAGTGFAGWVRGVVSAGGVDVGGCSSPVTGAIRCWLNSERSIAAGTRVTITFDGVTNATPGANKTVSVTTTSDVPGVVSAPFTVVPAGRITNVTVQNGAPSSAATARTRYVVGFTLSGTGGLSEDANSRIDVAFPAGTGFAGWVRGVVSAGGVDVGGCSSPITGAIQCWLNSDRSIAPSANVTIAFDGITNAPTPGSDKAVTVSTTSDPQATASAPFSVVAGGSLSGVGVSVGSLAPSALTRYVVRLTTSATGALAEDANSRLNFIFPAGTTFTGWTGGTVHDIARGIDVGGCSSPVEREVECWLYSDRTVATGATLRVTFGAITNPAAAGPYRLTASTTSDTAAVSSADYAQGEVVPPAPPAVSGPSEMSEGAAAQFAFGSTEPGVTFECSLDGAPFAACTSPKAYGALPAGAHSFRVRAVDATGLAGPVSTRSFVVTVPQQSTPTPTPSATASPTPTATATPSPTPSPEFKEDVVVAPVSGTIKICPKGPSGACTTLPAGAAIPMGTTVDARNGVVELTSLAAPGAAPQKARFYDGMFKVTQSATTTDLTLNEPLDCKGSKRAKAAAQKKKPKSRKLWGDGKGKFRTKGQYSAATIRGTKWLVQDTCTSTVTKVQQGVVSVRDEVKRKTITLRASKSYTAKPRNKR